MTTHVATAPKLYELNEEFSDLAVAHLSLVEEIELRGGEAADDELERLHDIERRLDEICQQSDLKILNIGRLCAEREIEIARLKAEEERILIFAESAAKRRKQLERSNAFFERYCLQAMHLQGKWEVTDGLNTLKIRENKSVEVTNLDQVPLQFIRGVNVSFTKDTPDNGKTAVFNTINKLRDGTTSLRLVDKIGAKKGLNDTEIPGLELKANETLKFS